MNSSLKPVADDEVVVKAWTLEAKNAEVEQAHQFFVRLCKCCEFDTIMEAGTDVMDLYDALREKEALAKNAQREKILARFTDEELVILGIER